MNHKHSQFVSEMNYQKSIIHILILMCIFFYERTFCVLLNLGHRDREQETKQLKVSLWNQYWRIFGEFMLAYNMLWSNDFYGHIVPSWMSEKKIS